MQANLFDAPIQPKAAYGVNAKEAPQGFYAVNKSEAQTLNACNSCDAKRLCQKNEDDWCLKNRCMSYEIVAFNGKTYGREDEQGVFFKLKP